MKHKATSKLRSRPNIFFFRSCNPFMSRTIHRAYTRGDRRRDDRRDSRLVYTLQATVAATNTCLIEQPTGDCRHDNRHDNRSDQLRRRSLRVYDQSMCIAASGHLHTSTNWLCRDLLTENQAFQDASDWIKLCGVYERIGADVEKLWLQRYTVQHKDVLPAYHTIAHGIR